MASSISRLLSETAAGVVQARRRAVAREAERERARRARLLVRDRDGRMKWNPLGFAVNGPLVAQLARAFEHGQTREAAAAARAAEAQRIAAMEAAAHADEVARAVEAALAAETVGES